MQARTTGDLHRWESAKHSSALANVVGLLCLVAFLFTLATAQTPDSPDQSWSSNSDSQDASVGSRTRRSESHATEGNRTIDKQSVQILRSGRYEPYQDIEKESVKVDANTTRTVVRTYGRDSSGRRVLIQSTEEEAQTLADGSGKVVRSTSNPDANGRLQLGSAKCRRPRS